jgi:HAD superfamily hydrolase (TIGR01490 family)
MSATAGSRTPPTKEPASAPRPTRAERAAEIAARKAVESSRRSRLLREDEAALAPNPRAAAFFDVDNTFMKGASIYYFARGLAKRGYFRTSDVVEMLRKQLSFVVRGTENLGHMADAQSSALAFVAGKPVNQLVRWGEDIYDEAMADKIYHGTLALARAHLAAGHQVWLVTATPVELADVIARRLGLTGALGTVAEVKAGVYTGRMQGDSLHGEAKAHAVRALARREGIDLAASSAYSDSFNDVPMLSMVGHPCPINPDDKLARYAAQHEWEMKDFRPGRRAAVPATAVGVLVGGAATYAALRHRHRI